MNLLKKVLASFTFRVIRIKAITLRGWIPFVLHRLTPKPHYLAVVAIFKNESHILKEWIDHYVSQGVSRIHLINNNSTDNYLPILNPYIRSGLVELHHDQRLYKQTQIYNDILPRVKREAEWLIACDLDEFIYARLGFQSISTFLKELDHSVSSVLIPWKMFGSSGHLTQPPEGVREGFVHRALSGEVNSEEELAVASPGSTKMGTWSGYNRTKPEYVKCISRTNRLVNVYIHFCWILFGRRILPDGANADPTTLVLQPINEELLASHALHLNHYPIQSLAFFQDVKMTRGDADYSKHVKLRNHAYFKAYDTNDFYDNELALISSQSNRQWMCHDELKGTSWMSRSVANLNN